MLATDKKRQREEISHPSFHLSSVPSPVSHLPSSRLPSSVWSRLVPYASDCPVCRVPSGPVFPSPVRPYPIHTPTQKIMCTTRLAGCLAAFFAFLNQRARLRLAKYRLIFARYSVPRGELSTAAQTSSVRHCVHVPALAIFSSVSSTAVSEGHAALQVRFQRRAPPCLCAQSLSRTPCPTTVAAMTPGAPAR
eukprot:1780891-Prymnesium_polylepis.3